MFSSRLPARLAPNAVSRAIAERRAAGTTLFDLTQSNPTKVGLSYPADVLAAPSLPEGRQYDPAPFGLPQAREAVAGEYVRRRTQVLPEQIVLTASTSEAYAILLKLLCNPGETVLVPQPSYPLFDLLTSLEGVPARPYQLDYHDAWSIDRASLERAITPASRAVLVVSPNNPTGSILHASDRDWLAQVCADRDLALVVDEVFADYPLSPKTGGCSVVEEGRALTFSLGGLSKSAGLPQIKLAWMAVGGPRDLVASALERLELICDTYLSVSTPVQVAASRLIEAGRLVRAAISERVARNLQALRVYLASFPAVTLLEPEGGWSAVLQVPATVSEEALVLRLIAQARVIVYPGYFFDFARQAFIVLSLLPDPAGFDEALARALPILSGDRTS